jgi:hypothetical protein
MSRLEDEVRSALKRQEPSPDFAQRVLSRLDAPPVEKTRHRPSWRSWLRLPRMYRFAAGLAACLLLALGVSQYHKYRVQVQGEAAKERLVLALKIAGGRLNAVQQKVLKLSAVSHQPSAGITGKGNL